MIVQSDDIQTFDTVVIIPITTFDLPNNKYRIAVKATPDNGLLSDSFLEVEKLSAVKKKFLGKAIGNISENNFIGIDESVASLLGIK